MSQITSHVLNTTSGKPAQEVSIILYQQHNDEWREIAVGSTDSDGRVTDLLKKEAVLDIGIYKIKFETGGYFDKQNIQSFYPFVEIIFNITSPEHYHIPLLISPHGFSTYRGS